MTATHEERLCPFCRRSHCSKNGIYKYKGHGGQRWSCMDTRCGKHHIDGVTSIPDLLTPAAALLAYHQACDKVQVAMAARDEAWAAYEQARAERERLPPQRSASAPTEEQR